MTAFLAVAGQGNIFKELPHSLEVVDVSNSVPPAPKDVSKVHSHWQWEGSISFEHWLCPLWHVACMPQYALPRSRLVPMSQRSHKHWSSMLSTPQHPQVPSKACVGQCLILKAVHLTAALQVTGLFWNYFSVGLDAQAAYGFHSLREKRPWAAPSRLINQGWYGYFSCTTGWFRHAPPVRNKVTLKVTPPPSPPFSHHRCNYELLCPVLFFARISVILGQAEMIFGSLKVMVLLGQNILLSQLVGRRLC